MVSGKKGDNSLSFPFGIRTSTWFLESRYEFMNSITIHYILYTIITLTLIISLLMKKKKRIMSNAYMVKRSWLFSLVFFSLWS